MTANDTGSARNGGHPFAKIAEIEARRKAAIVNEHGFLAEVLMTAHVPSFSPGMAQFVLERMLPPIDRVLAMPEFDDPEARPMLQRYRDSLWMIVNTAAFHQRRVIDEFQRHLRTAEADAAGLKDPDGLEVYQDLMKLANLGKKGQP